jgi:hypothetical protein
MISRIFFFVVIMFLLFTGFIESQDQKEIKNLQKDLDITLEGFIKGTEGNRYTSKDAKVDFMIRDEQIKLLRIEVDNIKKQINKNDN